MKRLHLKILIFDFAILFGTPLERTYIAGGIGLDMFPLFAVGIERCDCDDCESCDD